MTALPSRPGPSQPPPPGPARLSPSPPPGPGQHRGIPHAPARHGGTPRPLQQALAAQVTLRYYYFSSPNIGPAQL